MKYPNNHPSWTAYYRKLHEAIFVNELDKAGYGDNLIIYEDGPDAPEPRERRTIGIIKLMAFDELMAADPVTELRDVLDELLRDPMDGQRQRKAIDVMVKTQRFARKF